MKFKKLGPFSYYKGPEDAFISAWVTGYDNLAAGWEWGDDGYSPVPNVSLRLFGLDIIYFRRNIGGHYEIRFLGFWWQSS